MALIGSAHSGLLQILSNLANDYGDTVKGSDYSLDYIVMLPATACGLLAAAVLNINNLRDRIKAA